MTKLFNYPAAKRTLVETSTKRKTLAFFETPQRFAFAQSVV